MASGEMELRTQAHEFVKTFTVYDAQDREIEIFTARTDAADGDVCSKITMTYRNATSTQVEKYKEERATWSAAYDI